VVLSAFPIGQKFGLMKRGPFDDQSKCPCWQMAGKHAQGLDFDQHFLFSVTGVEMRRIVLVKEHLDHNPEEASDLRHGRVVPVSERGKRLPRVAGSLADRANRGTDQSDHPTPTRPTRRSALA